jgi:hypothetical protein
MFDVGKIERKDGLGRCRATEAGQCRAIDTRGDATEQLLDRPGAIHNAATELMIQRVGRSRPDFIFPNAGRKSTSIEFDFITASVHLGPFIQISRVSGWGVAFQPRLSNLAIAAFLSPGQRRKSLRQERSGTQAMCAQAQDYPASPPVRNIRLRSGSDIAVNLLAAAACR